MADLVVSTEIDIECLGKLPSIAPIPAQKAEFWVMISGSVCIELCNEPHKIQNALRLLESLRKKIQGIDHISLCFRNPSSAH